MKKEIAKYNEQYCILIPIYYEFEKKPAWRRVYTGNLKECKQVFDNYPDFLKASNDENAQNRKNKRQEYLFLLSINNKKQAEKIKEQYHL